jgi:hypothetical protein
LLIIVIAVTSATLAKIDKQKPVTSVTKVYQSIGLPEYEGLAWSFVVSAAGGSSVSVSK